MPQPKTPTPEIVTRYFQKFETNDIFRAGENGLRLLFHKFCPQNRILEHVLIKVAALDAAAVATGAGGHAEQIEVDQEGVRILRSVGVK